MKHLVDENLMQDVLILFDIAYHQYIILHIHNIMKEFE